MKKRTDGLYVLDRQTNAMLWHPEHKFFPEEGEWNVIALWKAHEITVFLAPEEGALFVKHNDHSKELRDGLEQARKALGDLRLFLMSALVVLGSLVLYVVADKTGLLLR